MQTAPNLPEPPETLKLSDAATVLGVHPNTLKRWVTDGKVPASRTLGGHLRFRRADLAHLLAEMEVA